MVHMLLRIAALAEKDNDTKVACDKQQLRIGQRYGYLQS